MPNDITKEVDVHLDLLGNKLKNAVVETPTTPTAPSPKSYVDAGDTFSTALSLQLQHSTTEVGGMPKNTLVHGKKISEIIEKVVFKYESAVYTPPTASMTVVFETMEVGVPISVTINTAFVANDSVGVLNNGYSFGSSDFPSFSSNVGSYTYTHKPIENNTWNAAIAYGGAVVVKNDNYGNPDATNMFPSGTISLSYAKKAYWAYYVGIFDGTPVVDEAFVKANCIKYLTDVPNLVIDVPTGSTKTVVVSVPNTRTLQVLKDGAMPITSTFNITNPTFTTGTVSKNYTLCVHNNGVGYNTAAKYQITFI